MTTMRQRRSGGVGWPAAAALAAAVAGSALVLAQTPGQQAPEPPPTTVGQIGAGGAQPTFRAGVTLVTTDLIVRDQDGIFVSDLTKDDLRVLEDGVEQEIASLVLVYGGRVFNQIVPPPPAQEGIILPTSRPPIDTAGRIFVLFVDDLHLPTSLTPRVRQVFEEIADTLVHEGDLFGIISTGPSSIAVDMTYDRARLYEAMDRITGDGLSITDQVRSTDSSQGPMEVVYRANVAFKTARNVLLNLQQVNDRRKAFIYISGGYDFDPFPESRMYSEPLVRRRRAGQDMVARRLLTQEQVDDIFSGIEDPRTDPFSRMMRQGQRFADMDLGAQLMELSRVANRANTSFYAIDPRGLVAGVGIDESIPLEEWNTHVFKTQNTLRVLAELTGGMAVVNRNDFDDALREIDAETSDYYVIGFYTNNPDPTVRSRRLTVEVVGSRADEALDVRARTHYFFPREPA